jgi:hypothetical protein
MIATATIDRIAHELLHELRTSPFGVTDPSGVPVARVFRCEDLDRLPPGLQQALVYKANQAVSRSWTFAMTVLTSVVALALVVLVAELVFGSRQFYFLLFAIGPLVPLMQLALTRQAVRRIAAQVSASWPGAGKVPHLRAVPTLRRP